MPSPTDLLVDNIKTAYQRMEKLVAVSLGASIWLLATALGNPTLAPDQALPKTALPLNLNFEAPAFFLAALALLVYFVSGVLLWLYHQVVRRALTRLIEQDAELAAAMSTYPSLLNLSPIPRLMLLLAMGAAGVLAVAAFYRHNDNFYAGMTSAILLASPYLLLFAATFWETARR